jgi:hypothetical protein
MNYLKATKKSLEEKKLSGTTLYMGIANTMDESMNITKVRNDSSDDTKHIRSILDLDNAIKSHKQNGLRYASKHYSNDNHWSVPLIVEYDGLRFIFDKYQFKLLPKDFIDTTVDLAKNMNNIIKRFQKYLATRFLHQKVR